MLSINPTIFIFNHSHNSETQGGTAPDSPLPVGVWPTMVPGRCLPADLWLLRGATTCTMFTTSVISWCDNSPTGSGTSCGCDTWNLAHVYLARNRGRCCKSAYSFSHSELGPHNEFTCTTRLLRSNLRTVGTSRWREHLTKSSITFHTGNCSAAPFLNVAFAPVRATDTFAELVETPRVDGAPQSPSPCPLPATSTSVTKSVTVLEWGGVHVFNCNVMSLCVCRP